MKHPYESRLLTYNETLRFLNFIDLFFWKNFEKAYTDSFTPDLEYDWIIISKNDYEGKKTSSIRELKRQQEIINGNAYTVYLQKLYIENPECLVIITIRSGIKKGTYYKLDYIYQFVTNRELQDDLSYLLPENRGH
jgi:hypothetical protein